ncbi:hypothetical protein [Mesorhizobium sp. B2-8-3]|uniref:hypothetical protein n=1 Tax=Mesorhizobium sp. B2-8-3 TaxID=2589905 RepID=UPI00112BE73E|nr:hypothetical protein [Mesorhizobium sp. B2-8-3]TPJ33662.1 hypothetical protein FJ418_13615 [Mesorhizobium sp. B2-8-3]
MLLAFVIYLMVAISVATFTNIEIKAVEPALARKLLVIYLLPAELACGVIISVAEYLNGVRVKEIVEDWYLLAAEVQEAWNGY